MFIIKNTLKYLLCRAKRNSFLFSIFANSWLLFIASYFSVICDLCEHVNRMYHNCIQYCMDKCTVSFAHICLTAAVNKREEKRCHAASRFGHQFTCQSFQFFSQTSQELMMPPKNWQALLLSQANIQFKASLMQNNDFNS